MFIAEVFYAFFTGIDMCFGQPINNDVLKLVQEEVVTLVTSVEENKETWMQDHEGLKTNLQNLTQLFALDIKRLEAKHVALESGLNDLKDIQLKIKDSVVEQELIASSNASLIQQVRDNFEEEHKDLRSQQEILEGKLVGLSRGVEKISAKENFFRSGTILLLISINERMIKLQGDALGCPRIFLFKRGPESNLPYFNNSRYHYPWEEFPCKKDRRLTYLVVV